MFNGIKRKQFEYSWMWEMLKNSAFDVTTTGTWIYHCV
jgi:hypothetical protein